jgi:hypothetical protein
VNVALLSRWFVAAMSVILTSCAKAPEAGSVHSPVTAGGHMPDKFAAASAPEDAERARIYAIASAADQCVRAGRAPQSWKAPLNPSGALAMRVGLPIYKDKLILHGYRSAAVKEESMVYLVTVSGYAEESVIYGPFSREPECPR